MRAASVERARGWPIESFRHNVVARSEQSYAPDANNAHAGAAAMQDLNDIYYFAAIVEHGSLSAASVELGVAKSLLSKHLSRLEAQLGVRLAQRTTRKLEITELGARFYERCRIALDEIANAAQVIDEALERPRGTVRVAAPVNFVHSVMAPLLSTFLRENPEVNVVLDATNREIDLVAEGYDLVLRIVPDIRDSTAVARSFRLTRHVLVASREFVAMHGVPSTPADLRAMPSLGGLLGNERGQRHSWILRKAGEEHAIAYTPRLLAEDVFVLKNAVLTSCGIADLPIATCRAELLDGSLVRLLPDWSLPDMSLYALYPSRRGLTPAVRCLLDYLSANLTSALEQVISGTIRLSVDRAA
jgi:DNA-binding transcriptional LysR family regulator